MKVVFLLCIVAVVSAEKFSIELEEHGEKFSETVKVDVAANTEEYDVPQHQDRAEMHLLKDFDQRLVAMKVPAAKACYIAMLEKREQSPQQLEKSLEMSKSKFPSERYMVEEKRSLVIRKMTNDEVGEKISTYCAGYDLVLTVNPKDNNIENLALQLAKPLQGKSKRDIINTFWACNIASSNVPIDCKKRNGRLAARCRFWRDDRKICVYEITCNTVLVNGEVGANCSGEHNFSLMQCCDYVCL